MQASCYDFIHSTFRISCPCWFKSEARKFLLGHINSSLTKQYQIKVRLQTFVIKMHLLTYKVQNELSLFTFKPFQNHYSLLNDALVGWERPCNMVEGSGDKPVSGIVLSNSKYYVYCMIIV